MKPSFMIPVSFPHLGSIQGLLGTKPTFALLRQTSNALFLSDSLISYVILYCPHASPPAHFHVNANVHGVEHSWLNYHTLQLSFFWLGYHLVAKFAGNLPLSIPSSLDASFHPHSISSIACKCCFPGT